MDDHQTLTAFAEMDGSEMPLKLSVSNSDIEKLVQAAIAQLTTQQPGIETEMLPVTVPYEIAETHGERHTPPTQISDWRDLIRFRVPPAIVNALRNRRPFYYTIQRIENAKSDNVNLDYYPVYVSRMPRHNGRQMTAASLFSYFRRNINSFLDPGESRFRPASTVDAARWGTNNPLGAVIYIDIGGWKVPDNAYVVCSDHTDRHWRFSTLTKRFRPGRFSAVAAPVALAIPDEHPVSGTREFGYHGTDQRAVFYTKGADRATFRLEAMNQMAFAGGHRLWLSFQREFVNWVNRHDGHAERFAFGSRPDVFISARHNWRQVDRAL